MLLMKVLIILGTCYSDYLKGREREREKEREREEAMFTQIKTVPNPVLSLSLSNVSHRNFISKVRAHFSLSL